MVRHSRSVITAIVATAAISVSAPIPAGTAQCQPAKLTASDAARAQLFGMSVAIDGDYALVDSFGSNFVFHRQGAQWIEEAKLAGFGRGGVIHGDLIVLGDAVDDEAGTDAGAANVLRREGLTWVLEAKLVASDASPGDWFGRSVDINGNLIVVGAANDDDAGLGAGSVYVFRWNGTAWIEEQKLIAADAQVGDQLGFCVSVSGNVILAGAPQFNPQIAPGKAYIFRRIGTTWIQEQKLTVTQLQPYEVFADSVAISGNFAVVGVPSSWGDEDPARPGSAYVFAYDGSGWIEEAKLEAGDFTGGGDHFGTSVAITDHVILVGASRGPEVFGSGTAYLFQRVGPAWIELATLTRSDPEGGDFFGLSVAVDGDHVLVGAMFDDDACPTDPSCNSGSAYVFSLEECGVTPIPAVSHWGYVVLTLLVLAAGTIVIKRRRADRVGALC